MPKHLLVSCLPAMKRNSQLSLQISLRDLIQYFVTDEDLTASILPTADKALLRSPEYSLDGE